MLGAGAVASVQRIVIQPPRVTVGLPTFNRAEGLERAAASVLAQTYEHLELVISDNASTDATPELCARRGGRPAGARAPPRRATSA